MEMLFVRGDGVILVGGYVSGLRNVKCLSSVTLGLATVKNVIVYGALIYQTVLKGA